MCFFFSLIPATIWVVLGYFILYSSTKTQGVTLTGLCPSIETMIKLKLSPPSKRTGLLDGLSADQRHTSALPPAISGLL
jgi:hypothetical protein